MECPACHRTQPEAQRLHTPGECVFCGVIFEKWENLRKKEEPPLPEPEAPKNEFTEPIPRGLLDISPEEKLAYQVDPRVRTVFALLIFFVEPLVTFLYSTKFGPRVLAFPPSVWVAALSFAGGLLAGMLAGRMGYSEALTGGGAGVLAGMFRSGTLYIFIDGPLLAKLRVALPVFGLYSVGAFLGGVAAWILRKFFGVKFN